MALLQRGLRGEPVRRLQQALNIQADGIFGAGTEQAVKDYQAANGLAVDGIAGPDTFSAMGLHELVIMQVGTRGECVKKVQAELNLTADGIFGKGTQAAVIAFQSANGLDADGIVGPETMARMQTFTEVDETVVTRATVPADYTEPEVPAQIESTATAEDKIKLPDALSGLIEKAKAKGSIWGTVKSMFN